MKERKTNNLPTVETKRGGEEIQNEILTRGVVEIISEEGLRRRLSEGKPLRIKYGIDPTIQSGHIGHAVPIRKLRQFQELGHTAVFIIGDITARIGDPTGRTAARKFLSEQEVKENAQAYFEQAYKILDRNKTEIRLQSEWYGKFDLSSIINLMAKMTYGQLMAHETFSRRVAEGKQLGFHEMLYPLLQAYDSVSVNADVELGGIDQKFNFVLTRDLQKTYGQEPEEVILMRYLPGTNGQEKMSKSLSNTIDLLSSAEDMYFKIMSIPDNAMPAFFELATNLSMTDIQQMLSQLKANETHPMQVKKLLAKNITRLYHSQSAVETAEEKFSNLVQKKQPSEEDLAIFTVDSGKLSIAEFLTTNGIVRSKSEVRRLIKQGAIEIDGKTLTEFTIDAGGASFLVRVGKKRMLKIIPK